MRRRWGLFVAMVLALGALAAAPLDLGGDAAMWTRVGGPDWASRLTLTSTQASDDVLFEASGDPALIGWNTMTVVTASTASYCCWVQDPRVSLDSPYVVSDTVENVDGGTDFRDGGFNPVDGGHTNVDGGFLVDGSTTAVDGGRSYVDGGFNAVDGGITQTDGGVVGAASGNCAGWAMQPGQSVSVLPIYPVVAERAAARYGVCTSPAVDQTSIGNLVYAPCRVSADCAALGAGGTCDISPSTKRRLESGAYIVCRSDESTGAVIDVRTER